MAQISKAGEDYNIPYFYNIAHTVGKHGANLHGDVMLVQALLKIIFLYGKNRSYHQLSKGGEIRIDALR